MGNDLDEVRNHYVDLYGEAVRSASRLQELHDHYGRRSEASLLDAITATTALDAFFLSDQVDLGQVTPQMRRAFALAFPNKSLSDLNDLSPESAKGWLAAWKGKFFEVVVEDKLNAGEQVGDLRLGLGQIARLADSPTQPGFDLEIVNSDGNIDQPRQLKATESLGYVKKALETYPGIRVPATAEAASDQLDAILNSGIGDEAIDGQVAAPLADLLDNAIKELFENIAPGLPFVLIATTEGARVLMGRQTFQQGVERALRRGTRTGVAMSAGALAALAGAGVLSLPVASLTRLGMDRHQIGSTLIRKLRSDRAQLEPLQARSDR
ncbi:MAG: hypothetical protein IIC31_03235 [Chloroflexi bacterium]|nr:hypothetical protein [Chloroflexota bacterium]